MHSVRGVHDVRHGVYGVWCGVYSAWHGVYGVHTQCARCATWCVSASPLAFDVLFSRPHLGCPPPAGILTTLHGMLPELSQEGRLDEYYNYLFAVQCFCEKPASKKQAGLWMACWR